MASLSMSDLIAELTGRFRTLKGKSIPPEIDDDFRSFEETFTLLQDAWKLKDTEIRMKDTKIDALNDEVDKLKAGNTTYSAYEGDPLESKNSKIKELENQVTKLEAEKEILTKEVEDLKAQVMDLKEKLEYVTANNKSLESDVVELKASNKSLKSGVVELKANNKSLKSDVVALKANNKSLKSNVVELEEKNSELEGKMMGFEEELLDEKGRNSKLREDLRDLKTENTTIKEKIQKLETLHTENKLLKREVGDLERKIDVPNDDLLFGQLCRRVQSMIFEKILPQGYYDKTASYMIRDLDDEYYFSALFKGDERKISEANEAWRKLKMTLQWQDKDVKHMAVAMGVIQRERNLVAHPELTEDKLTELTQRMKDAGKVNGFHSADMVTQLTNVWKQLNRMP